jgi:hypothetical protein
MPCGEATATPPPPLLLLLVPSYCCRSAYYIVNTGMTESKIEKGQIARLLGQFWLRDAVIGTRKLHVRCEATATPPPPLRLLLVPSYCCRSVYYIVNTGMTASKIEKGQIARLLGQFWLRDAVIGTRKLHVRCTFGLFQRSQLSIFAQRSLKRFSSNDLCNGTIQRQMGGLVQQIVAIIRGAPSVGFQIGLHSG